MPVLFLHIPRPPRQRRRRPGAKPARLGWHERLAAAFADVAVDLLGAAAPRRTLDVRTRSRPTCPVAIPLLSLRGLDVRFRTGDGVLHAVKGLDLDVAPGETVAIVGESGSGKSQTAHAVMGLLSANGWAEGSVRYRGTELIGLAPAALNRIRGAKIAMIFQEPMTSLDPLYRIGDQIALPLIAHRGLSRRAGPGAGGRAPRSRAHRRPGAAPRRPTRTSSRAASASAS